ncbi:phenylalanine--tRNA ligase alpha subunit isoform X4 [Numida meleagris]|uniref:phenylalanine--tRNA ligase alpha subunit isoform X4 n=1 Tax=Numida meleagris TaxID=8996 RepID=UPI000B3DA05B|nr:phenylalanine--tRNA ligase alpha subunit isoform X4 [Numida meleagris]
MGVLSWQEAQGSLTAKGEREPRRIVGLGIMSSEIKAPRPMTSLIGLITSQSPRIALRPHSLRRPERGSSRRTQDGAAHSSSSAEKEHFRVTAVAFPAVAMSPSVAELLLQRLERTPPGPEGGLCSLEAATALGLDHQTLVGAVKSLQALGKVIEAETRATTRWELSAEGAEGLLQSDAMKLPGAQALTHRAVRQVDAVQDTVQNSLRQVQEGNGNSLSERERTDLKKRKLLLEVTLKSYWIRKGSAFSTAVVRQETDLTPEMIATGSWRKLPFKAYNFSALGLPPTCGHLHPLLKVRSQLRQIFLEMGFTEMPTDNFVESSFWNFDALFQPQQHPARDQHDTFFLQDPAEAPELPTSYMARVKKVHSQGGYGSQGYKYEWKVEEARKNLLRTHTTSASARALYHLAHQGKFTPVKYFSIDRVFRNESLDATHLAEFHQVEGVVADRGLTLGHLMGILHQFFTKLGISKLRFKPAYNPYTEPSMEVFSYHEGLKKWVEVGNSGVFRPELLLPMGLPESVSVIAWGLSLERPTMIKYGINNIRELVGHRVNLQMIYDSPLCRLDA